MNVTTCYIGVGSNLGDRRAQIEAAGAMVRASEGVVRATASPLYETEPVSDIPQGRFLNGVLEVETTLSARALLARLLEIERILGRTRGAPNTPRTIDLDLLLYGDAVIDGEDLTVPHPRMHERDFVLRPLVAMAPAAFHPRLGCTVKEIISR